MRRRVGRRWIPCALTGIVIFFFCGIAPCQEAPAVQTQLHEEIPADITSPTEVFAIRAKGEVLQEFEKDLGRLNNKAMRVWFFTGEYDNPTWAFDELTAEDRFPERYDEFEDWVEDNIEDGLLDAIENHPNTKDAVDSFLSLFSPGITSDWEDGEDFDYSDLVEEKSEMDKEKRRTLNLLTLNGPAQALFGRDHRAVARMRWLHYDDGLDDLVRWEARVQNVHLLGDERLALDEIKAEFTYESAKFRVYKARPFGLPLLAQASFEAEPDDTEWGLVFTREQRSEAHRAKRMEKAPLLWKLDFGVTGDNDETRVGFIFRGTF